MCGWLRVAVSYIKRRANGASEGWDDPIVGDDVRMMLTEVVEQVKRSDPASGRWDVAGDKAKVWVDASSLATGVVVEVDGSTIEDASWLRTDDASHINMAELDAVIKGLNVALVWGFKEIELLTDSATVHRWICDGLSGKNRLKTKASSEMLIRRRVDIVTSLVAEYGLQVAVRLVPSADNKADALTRVPQRWLRAAGLPQCGLAVSADTDQRVAEIHHSCGHPGRKRTLHFVRRALPSVTKADVKRVVARCDACQSVDPAPVRWSPGRLDVEAIWQRVAMDITHFRGRSYLSLIDCGPSRFSVWRPLRMQTSAAVIEQLEAVFWERGAPEELLTDNDPAFRSRQFETFGGTVECESALQMRAQPVRKRDGGEVPSHRQGDCRPEKLHSGGGGVLAQRLSTVRRRARIRPGRAAVPIQSAGAGLGRGRGGQHGAQRGM